MLSKLILTKQKIWRPVGQMYPTKRSNLVDDWVKK